MMGSIMHCLKKEAAVMSCELTKVQDSTFAQPQAARQGDAQGWAS